MPKRVKFEGNTYTVPDDATDQEISTLLQQHATAPSGNQTQPTLTNQQPSLIDKSLTPAGDLMYRPGATRDAIMQVAGYTNSPGAWLQRKLGIADKYTQQEGEQGADYANRLAGMGPDPNHPYRNAAAVAVGGASKDVGDLGASFTSPVALATMGAGAFGKAGQAAQKLIGAGFALKGARDVVENTPAALQGNPDAAQRALYGGAMVAGGAPSAIDVVGKPVSAVAKRLAPSMMNYAIGTPTKAMRYGKNPGQEVVDQGLADVSMENLHQKINDTLTQKSQELHQTLTSPQASAMRIDISPAVKVVDNAIGQAMRRNQPQLLEQLREVRDQLTTNLAPTGKRFAAPLQRAPYDVVELKRGIQEGVNWNTGAGYEKPLNAVKKQVQGVLDGQVVKAIPEVGPLNESVSNLIDANNASGDRAAALATGKHIVRSPELAAGGITAASAGGPAGAAMFTIARGARTVGGLTYGAKTLAKFAGAKLPASAAKSVRRGITLAAAAGAASNQDEK